MGFNHYMMATHVTSLSHLSLASVIALMKQLQVGFKIPSRWQILMGSTFLHVLTVTIQPHYYLQPH